MFTRNLFGNEEFRGSLKLSSMMNTEKKSFRSRVLPRTASDSRNLRSTTKLSAIEPNLEDVYSKLRKYMKTSSKTLEDAFLAIDTQNSGVVTNLEFKEAIRSLNIGFTSREVDELIVYIRPDEHNRINWVDFVQKFKDGPGEKKILERTRQRLHNLKD